MPRRKKSTCNPRKPPLPFLEDPLQGPLHEYGSPLQKAENPRYVPAKPLDQSTSASWVSPQFDHTVDLHFPGRRRRHISNSTLQLPPRTRKASESLINASKAHRKPSVCKFPPLDFSSLATASSNLSDSPLDVRPVRHTRQQAASNIRSKNATGPVTRTSPQSPLLQAFPLPLLQEAAADTTFSPPDLQTPDTTPLPRRSTTRIRRLLLPPEGNSEGRSLTPLPRGTMGLCGGSEYLNGSSGTPEGLQSFPVLVADTPEHEYGVKITWRRRHELMKYLKERGKLKSSEILVKRGLSASLKN